MPKVIIATDTNLENVYVFPSINIPKIILAIKEP